MDALVCTSIDTGRTTGGPNPSLKNGGQPVAKLGIFEGSEIRGRSLVVYAKMGSNVAVAARAEFSPNCLQSHVTKDGVTLVLDDVDTPNEGNHPGDGVGSFGIEPP